VRIAYLDCFSGISGNMVLGALLDAGLDRQALEEGLRRLPLPPWEMRVWPVLRRSVGGTYVEILVEGRSADLPAVVPVNLPGGATGEASEHRHLHPHPPEGGVPMEAPRHGHLDPHPRGGGPTEEALEHRHLPPRPPGGGVPMEAPQHGHQDPHPRGGGWVVEGPEHGHSHGPYPAHGGAGSLAGILEVIRASRLPAPVIERSCQVFRRLAEAEARVHRVPADQVHFHEVGAVDALLDIVGSVLGLHLLGVEEVWCSPLPQGHGFVQVAHGTLPLPAPATAYLERGLPLRFVDVAGEMVTPTGAALAATLARFDPPPLFAPTAVGYGAGSREFPHPNLLRLFVGETVEPAPLTTVPGPPRAAVVCEANLDDHHPQLLAALMERLFAEGALDVAFVPLQMKKSRPGVQIQVVAPTELARRVCDLILAETSTLGVRFYPVEREVLERRQRVVQTAYGPVRVKVAGRGPTLHRTPEFEDCQDLARQKGVPVRLVYEAALAQALREEGDPP
jgi:uncharacterized protein (TIGR00299 family) protein